MLVDLAHAVGGYLFDVFAVKFDWWVLLGFVAQAMFTMRFVVQWIASEREGKSVIPLAFWFFSIGGGLLLLGYALYRKDPVFIVGQAFGVFVYLRNLYFVMRNHEPSEVRVKAPAKTRKIPAQGRR
ncbi:MAG TPA: lipid-A-disaccharide synthase N-terminal domain-containing protein [Pseudorhodoplanes sp.]|nr:lipid-A-disaccharide synthase N-terminal domain-containing protein [Pseudorhodoplanes sp.]